MKCAIDPFFAEGDMGAGIGDLRVVDIHVYWSWVSWSDSVWGYCIAL